jgi:hypothetical protein
MTNQNLTDKTYDVVERIDLQKQGLKVAIMAFVLPALMCSAASGYFYFVSLHQKGGLSDINLALIALSFLICIALLAIASKKIIKFVELKNKLNGIEALEETISKEVLKYETD